MEKIAGRILATLIILVLMIAVVPIESFAATETENFDRDFNLFLDTQGATEEFFRTANRLFREQQGNHYFSVMTMTLDEPELSIDGQKTAMSYPVTIDNKGNLILPTIELCNAVGAEAELDTQTGEIILEKEGVKITLDAYVEKNEQYTNVVPSSTVSVATKETLVAEATLQNINQIDKNTINKIPVLNKEQAEEIFCLDILQDGEKIIVTRPYQTKGIFLYVKNGGTLKNHYQASAMVNNNGVYYLQYETEQLAKNAYAAFQQDESVQYVTLDAIYTTNSLPSPGSWGTDGNKNSMGIQASRFKNYLQDNDEEIIVAVLDTGVDAEYLPETETGREGHSHLQGRTTVATSATDDTAGYNFIDLNNNPYDARGHGTHVAGTIVDCTPDNVTIMPVKVLNDQEGASIEICDTSSIVLGIDYAVNHGAKIINMSLGHFCATGMCPTKEKIAQVVTNALEQNQTPPIFVVSAGNDDADTQMYCPANLSTVHDNVITVAAVDQMDLRYAASCYGDAVDVCAPGVDILSSYLISADTNDGVVDGYTKLTGTSMAAPHVSAAVAMLMLEYPNYTPLQIKTLLKSMTVDLGAPGEDPLFGAGRIDFRLFNSETLPAITPVSAQSLAIKRCYANSGAYESVSDCELLMYSSNYSGIDRIMALVLPKDATDKSTTYTISDPTIATLSNETVITSSPGITRLSMSKTGLASDSCLICVDNYLTAPEAVPYSLTLNDTTGKYDSEDLMYLTIQISSLSHPLQAETI